MIWKSGKIDGVIVSRISFYTDSRGWLAEFFRKDMLPKNLMPVMSYISMTHPDTSRGPHEHRRQTDLFGFFGPGNFLFKVWDNRKESKTYGHMLEFIVGEDNPVSVIVPPRVIHAYRNISETDSMVINAPNRLYKGENKNSKVDEIRYENKADCDFHI